MIVHKQHSATIRGSIICRLLLVVLFSYLSSMPDSATIQAFPRSSTPVLPAVTTIPITNGKPTAIAIDQSANKWYVADSVQGNLLAYINSNNQLKATIPIAKGIYPGNLIIDETYGRLYAASEASFNSEFGQGDGLIYSIDTANDTLLKTFDPSPLMSKLFYSMAYDQTHHRIYLNGTGGLAYIDIASNMLIPITLSNDIQSIFFLIDEMVVNETTNTLYMLQDSYIYERLWILAINTNTWSYIDFPTLGARNPQHLAISESTNKVFVKVVQMPDNNLPGLYVLNRNNGSYSFIGHSDYGPMVVNETSQRLYTGVEVATEMAIVDTTTNMLVHIPMEGATTAIGVHNSTDHVFLANAQVITIVDGASQTLLKIQLSNQLAGGILVQDVAINQATGWAYIIPDARVPEVIAIHDLPPGRFQWFVYLPSIFHN